MKKVKQRAKRFWMPVIMAIMLCLGGALMMGGGFEGTVGEVYAGPKEKKKNNYYDYLRGRYVTVDDEELEEKMSNHSGGDAENDGKKQEKTDKANKMKNWAEEKKEKAGENDGKEQDGEKQEKTDEKDSAETGAGTKTKDKCVKTALFGCVENDGKGGPVFMILNVVLNILLYGVGTLAVIGLVITGIQYSLAKGDVGKVTEAKKRIFNIAVGLVLYASLLTLIKWLIPGGVGK